MAERCASGNQRSRAERSGLLIFGASRVPSALPDEEPLGFGEHVGVVRAPGRHPEIIEQEPQHGLNADPAGRKMRPGAYRETRYVDVRMGDAATGVPVPGD